MRDAKRVLAVSFLLGTVCFGEGIWLCKETQPFLDVDGMPSPATSIIVTVASLIAFFAIISTVQSFAAFFSKWVAELRLRWLLLGDPMYFDLGVGDNVYLPAGGLVSACLSCGFFSQELGTEKTFFALLFGASPAILQLVLEFRRIQNNVPDG